jgi:hypothetical protein
MTGVAGDVPEPLEPCLILELNPIRIGIDDGDDHGLSIE